MAADHLDSDVRTVGIEEELLLLDPVTRLISSRSGAVVQGTCLDQELFQHQVETHTAPVVDLDDAYSQLVAARRIAGGASRAVGLAAVAAAVVPIDGAEPRVTANDRYRTMVDTFGETARGAGTCGLHVHVAITSAEEGVAAIDRVAPWLPALLAMSANSPFAHGRDTCYASWRSQMWARWPSAGPTEAFGSLEGYREVCRTLQTSGAARDEGMLYFDARLSTHQPTVEVRVLDVCTDPGDSVLLAALVRALVTRAARHWSEGGTVPTWRSEALRAAQWRAARWGATDRLVDPVSRDLRPAREVISSLVDSVRLELDEAGDTERVRDGVDRVLRSGGASRQHAAYERAGDVEGVVDDLVARTEEVWA